MLDEYQLARVCYMLQFEIQLALKEPLPHWDDTPDWMRGIWVEGVRLVQLGCSPDTVHAHWRDRMTEQGWTHGSTRDAGRRTHPMLLPLDELDQASRAKIQLIQATIVMLTLNMPASQLGSVHI